MLLIIHIMLSIMIHHTVASQGRIKDMIEMESKAVSLLENYIMSSKENLLSLEKLITDYKEKHNFFQNHLGSSDSLLNSYIIIRQLTTELNKLEQLVFDATADYEQSMEILKKEDTFPEQNTLINFKNSIMELQKLYMLSAHELLSLNTFTKNGSQSLPVSARDILELAKHAFENHEELLTEEWITEFEKKCSMEDCNQDLIVEGIEYKGYIKYLLGDIKTARDLMEQILAIDPSHPIAKGNLEFFNNEINQIPDEKRSNTNLRRPDGFLNVDELFSFTCRGVIQPPIDITSRLKCRYVHYNSPFLRLAPLKEEEMYPDPKIVSYKDIISDNEIEVIKNLSQAEFQPSYTVSGKSKIRISKQAWIHDVNEVITRLSRRIGHITGLVVQNSSEPLQVVNYGIGGYYTFHKDSFGQSYTSDRPHPRGDRLATFLLYLNDVKSGGGTSFPLLKLLNKPEKGSAILWYSLDESGYEDNRTLHGGCPVLEGEKWIANKWIWEERQTFTRLCPSSYKRYVPLPEYKINPLFMSI